MLTKCLLIGSIEAYSGKSGTILGIAQQLQEKGVSIAYSKPIGSCGKTEPMPMDEDVEFMAQILGLSKDNIGLPLVYLHADSLEKRLKGLDTQDYSQLLLSSAQKIAAEVLLLEGAGNLGEGSLFDLSLQRMAQVLDASVIVVTRYTSVLVVDGLLQAKKELGDRLLGVVINDAPLEQLAAIEEQIKPYLEGQQIPVLGLLPRHNLLRSVSVRELTKQLKAEILCRPDRLDLMVESLTIGAMNVNAALEYFRKGRNMAVVTGGDRTDLQMAALETSTNCLILTGHLAPDPLILSRAEDLEVPILAVNSDTLTTVEIVDQAFGKVRLQEQIKVDCLGKLMRDYFDLERLIGLLNLEKKAV